MVNPLSQVDIEQEIQRINALLEHQITAHAKRLRDYADKDRAYDIAYAKARRAAKLASTEKLTQGDADDLATEATEAEREARDTAEALLDAAKEAGRNYREILSSLRTLAANQRALVSG